MTQFLGFKIRNTVTGLFCAPGIIGGHWSKVGRTYSTRSALGNSIAVWQEHCVRYKHLLPSARDPKDWVIVAMTNKGTVEYAFNDWVACKGTKKTPAPFKDFLRINSEEIDMVEEAMRNEIGDADEAGELSQRVVAILRQYEVNEL